MKWKSFHIHKLKKNKQQNCHIFIAERVEDQIQQNKHKIRTNK